MARTKPIRRAPKGAQVIDLAAHREAIVRRVAPWAMGEPFRALLELNASARECETIATTALHHAIAEAATADFVRGGVAGCRHFRRIMAERDGATFGQLVQFRKAVRS